MMMVCKGLCDISSDLPMKEFKGVLKLIKNAKDMIRNGKAVIVKEVSSFHDSEEDESDCDHEIVEQDLINLIQIVTTWALYSLLQMKFVIYSNK